MLLVYTVTNSFIPFAATMVVLTVRSTHHHFTLAFDHLQSEEVVWDPYSWAHVEARVGALALSSLCARDGALWMTKKKLVLNIWVEDYTPHRVMRQFGLHQQIPPQLIDRLPSSAHL